MSKEIKSFDDKYFAIEQEDKNFVIYDITKDPWIPLWDRWSYEGNNNFPNSPPISIPASTIPNPMLSTPKLILENVNPIGMSYWRNINYHEGHSEFLVALSVNDQLRILKIRKIDLTVIDDKSLGIAHTGEGIFFSAHRYDILFIPLDGELITVNVFDGSRNIVWNMPDHKLWQIHSNYDENTFSATLQNSNWEIIGWAVGGKNSSIFLFNGMPDECQIDKSGNWLLIKEDNDNRIIHLPTGAEKIVTNDDGAVGHSDNGFNCTLGENDFSNKAGALDLINFQDLSKQNMYSTGIWNMGYCSFTNAKPGLIENQFCLITTPNELIKVKLDGSGFGQKICNNLTESQVYEYRPKANLCPLGEYAVWTAFVNGSLNAYVVRVY